MDGIEQKTSSSYKQWFLIALIVGAALLFISGGVWVYQKTINSRKTDSNKMISPTPSVSETEVTPEVTPEVSPSDTVKAEVTIQILNGGGVKGEAAKAAALLEAIGYQNIKTGNADKFTYKETEISAKENRQELVQEISEALAAVYEVSSTAKSLEDKEIYDLVIIIGQRK